MSKSDEQAVFVFDEPETKRLLASWNRESRTDFVAIRVNKPDAVELGQLHQVLSNENFTPLTKVKSARLVDHDGSKYIRLRCAERSSIAEARQLADDFIVRLNGVLGSPDRTKARAKARKSPGSKGFVNNH